MLCRESCERLELCSLGVGVVDVVGVVGVVVDFSLSRSGGGGGGSGSGPTPTSPHTLVGFVFSPRRRISRVTVRFAVRVLPNCLAIDPLGQGSDLLFVLLEASIKAVDGRAFGLARQMIFVSLKSTTFNEQRRECMGSLHQRTGSASARASLFG
ncbi:MAG: hypothetical protein LBE67_18290 [Kocuria palustris]|nr:hypothetical protein [Kocuria palustris]